MSDDNTGVEQSSEPPREPVRHSPEELRRRADALFAIEQHVAGEALTLREAEALNYELRVHQIELEMQNEQLRATQEDLAISHARYFDLWNLAPVGYLTLDDQGVILESNLTATNLLGVTRKDLPNRPLHHFVLREDRDGCYLLRRLLATGERQVCEVRMLRAGTETFWARLEAIAAQDADGAVTHRVAVTDISDQRQTSEALRESESKYRAVADNTCDWEFWLDPAQRFVYCSPSCERIAGHQASEFLQDRTLLERIIHADDRELMAEHLHCCGEAASEQGVYFRVVRADGEIRWVEHLCQPIFDDEGHFLGRRGSNRDITRRRHLEEELRQAQKMESIGRLAGGVAHDYNNMLTVILGQAQLALRRTDSTHPLHHGLLQIEKTAKRSAALTQHLLAFARKQTISPKVLDLNAVLGPMLGMLHTLIGENISLVWLPGEGLWTVNMDPVQVDQILANLCLNARDAITGTGKITIETSNVTLDAAYCDGHESVVPGEFVRLTVTDDGCGMDSETLAHVFEPFYTTKGLGEGTGLGLATVYGITKQNGGAIDARSEPGQQTTFDLYLPRYVGEIEEAEAGSLKGLQRGRGEQVLVVEDNPAVLELAKAMLECLDYKVLTASTPVEALHLAKEHAGELHLLLSDVVMPGMNGRELATELRAACPGLKTLFMSGYTADVIARQGVLEEGVHFIQKPFLLHDLAAAVRELLDRG